VSTVFGLECLVVPDPVTATPLVVPVPARHRAGSNGDGTVLASDLAGVGLDLTQER
jgi:hypothetical protein